MTAETLVPFGFTALESDIYIFLLRESPATGYRIAQGINKPAANTYKAIQTLQTKGAILVEEGANRTCRAVPLAELMNRLQKDFESRRKDLEKQLKSIRRPPEDDRIYILRSRDQILSRVREMLSTAKATALLKLPTFAIHAIEGDIEKCAERGVQVSVLTSDPLEIDGVDVTPVSLEKNDGICVVIDASQTTAGSVLQEGDCEAVWTQSATLASIHFIGLSAEIALGQIAGMLASDEKRSRMIRAIENRHKLP
ncbi:MAG: hypothetical protein H7Y17_01225 [Chlorobia bacterium]|nr:hypothetical protein [Fimbriimonadaceae bacterium]